MGSRNFDIALLQARFDGLTDLEKAGEWVGFLDTLDAGGVGYHPYYLILAPMWERGETPFDAERLELMERYTVAEDDFAFDDYELEFEALEPVDMEPASLRQDYEIACGQPF